MVTVGLQILFFVYRISNTHLPQIFSIPEEEIRLELWVRYKKKYVIHIINMILPTLQQANTIAYCLKGFVSHLRGQSWQFSEWTMSTYHHCLVNIATHHHNLKFLNWHLAVYNYRQFSFTGMFL